MDEIFLDKLKMLLWEVWKAEPDFYRAKFNEVGIDGNFINAIDEARFGTLPLTTKKEIAVAPYRSRLYHEKSGLNKLINCEDVKRYFLIHRTLEEIREDNLPIEGTRPMVLLSDVYEAIERCLFFYEHNILPLIGEYHNPAVVTATARQYSVDSIFIDHDASVKYREKLLGERLPIKSITVVDSAFYPEDFYWPDEMKKHFVLSLPETGRLAYGCPVVLEERISSMGRHVLAKNELVLHPYPDVYIEHGALSKITSMRLKACPLIRYQISVFLESVSSGCGCGASSFLM